MATPRKKNPKKRGRKTDFKQEYVDLARKYCLLGAIDEQLATFFNVKVSTINNWKKRFPDFLEAIKAGKEQADADIADSLYHRAKGYSHPDVDIKIFKGKVITTKLTKHYPPDTKAIMFWMSNRRRPKQPDDSEDRTVWAERQEVDHTTKGEKLPVPMVYLPQDLDRSVVQPAEATTSTPEQPA